MCGVKENGITEFQSWKKSQQEGKGDKLGAEATGCCQALSDRKGCEKMWDQNKSALWCVCLQ